MSWPLSSSGLTETGAVRQINQDAFLEHAEAGLWAVADGMGGHKAGELASRLVVDTLAGFRQSRHLGRSLARLTRLLSACNAMLVEEARLHSADAVGCTLAALLVHGQQIIGLWSGDSRIYRLRAGRLRCLTHDHSQANVFDDRNRFIDANDASGHGNMLTQAIGGDAELQVERCWYRRQPDDRYLLCSDGLYKEVSDNELTTLLAADGIEPALARLAARYRERGARDNLAMICIQCD